MKVLKFGGTSIATSERIKHVVDLILSAAEENAQTVVVVSAFGGITDSLLQASRKAAEGGNAYEKIFQEIKQRHLEIIDELFSPEPRSAISDHTSALFQELEDVLRGVSLVKELSTRTRDYVLSFGERLSAFIISKCVENRGRKSEFLDARSIIKTNINFGGAEVNFEDSEAIIRQYLLGQIDALQIVTGFIASSTTGETTTLGRGGSDFTAALIGAALDVQEIEIWTDVDGMMTADPRKVPKAYALEAMSYEEAMELCHFGAKVLYPPTLRPAIQKNITICIRNTFKPEAPGTRIQPTVPQEVKRVVTGISSISEASLLLVRGGGMVGVAGISDRLFGTLARNKINIIMITQASSEHTICLALSPEDATRAIDIIRQEFTLELQAGIIEDIAIEEKQAIVSVVGERMRNTPGIAARLFHALGRNDVNITAIAQGSSELNISIAIRSFDERKALNAIHDEFFLSDARSVNVFLAGVGNIGKTLLSQIHDQHEKLVEKLSLDIRVVGMARTGKFLIDESGLPPTPESIEQVTHAGHSGDMKTFVNEMFAKNLPSSVFIDCTASEEVVDWYQIILEKSIPIVTPNKKAQTRSFAEYQALKETAKKKDVRFLFETSVGASLPIVGTLWDLIHSGDKILAIEAVLSGTLSYVFSSLSQDLTLSQALKQAQELGYTEPDLRDDLSGLDVGRKLLILAREAGCSLELDDIEIENLTPLECRNLSHTKEFLSCITQHDAHIEERRHGAEKEGKRLRYIAEIQDEHARVGLREVASSHPFFDLQGADNVVAFTTERYRERPLVIKGPGAGAAVTAAGVFANLIRLIK